ncbi:TIGR02221 family CRISPR-associated protein [Tepidimonas charontis]|uniref:CRISPR-associated protein n=1 Tax=Tepidimonas charontis TaxID=2267262 RepID=A0A554X3M9_9BURK|nr:TIGR02221 family CRISPR-associated protein [Tepidimonas charontis]TSE30403.1 CRISPR-associated protein [Tepidimonas charontis]
MSDLTLISFLGRSRLDRKTGYKTANYRFADGRIETTPFFGLALCAQLKPSCMLLLGTQGSMWDALAEHLSGDEAEELRIELMDAVESARVDQALLDRLTPLVEKRLGMACQFRLIPYGADGDEQIGILSAIAEAGLAGPVVIDVTHGFRHLAALGLVAAFFLERAAKLDIRGLYYGALDMTVDGITPVVRLDGPAAVQDWVAALDHYDANGDYGVFAPLLVRDGVPEDKARCLEEAAFHERTFNLSGARQKLLTFLPVLEGELAGASRLFRRELQRRLSWVHEGGLPEYQRKLAYEYLRRRDYVRAAVFAWEAVVSKQCVDRGLSLNDFRAGREPAIDAFEAEIQAGEHPDGMAKAYWSLKNLRNALAHGNPPSVERYRRMLADAQTLHRELEAAIQRLLG